jgi:hypothetical protein
MSRLPILPTRYLLLTAAFLAAPQLARAQGQGPTASLQELEAKFDSTKKTQFMEMLLGKRQPTDANQAVLKAAAEFYVYRLRVQTFQAQPNKLYQEVVRQFEKTQKETGQINTNPAKPVNAAFQQRWNKELLTCFREVLDRNPEAQVVINAAVMLPPWAANGREEVADYLAELVADPKRSDAVKLYALKGLGEFFKAAPPDVGPLGAPDKKERDAKRIQAVIDFVKRKSPVSAEAPPDQLEAVRYVRREAVRALGQIQSPAVEVEVKQNKVMAPVAATLLMVLAGKAAGLDPPPSLPEQVDAAVAMCRMKGARISEYDQALALPFLAVTLAQFATEYNGDYKNVILTDKQRGTLPGGLHPWMAMSRRLRSGLQELGKNNPAVAAQAADLAKRADVLLNTTADRKLAVIDPVITGMRSFAQAAAPKVKAAPVYKGIKDKALEIPIE